MTLGPPPAAVVAAQEGQEQTMPETRWRARAWCYGPGKAQGGDITA